MAAVSSIPYRGGELRVYIDDVAALATVGNVDVEVVDDHRRRWSATFFTIAGVEALFQKNAVTGECARGTYLWASDMILVRSLSLASIQLTIDDLRKAGEFEQAFSLLEES